MAEYGLAKPNTSQAELLERISKFLEIRLEHVSGWVKPFREDIDEFYEIIEAIRDAKWDRDEDNHPTIEIRLTDRSIGWQPWVPLVPYRDYDEPLTDEHWLTARSLLDTVETMSREVRLLIETHRFREDYKK